MPRTPGTKAFAPVLDSLDTLIAFSVIMTVLSLLIAVAVQMLSSVLNLRGKNLAQGLVETFLTVGGNKATAGMQISKDEARKLAGYLLTRTGLSGGALDETGSISSEADRVKFAHHDHPLGKDDGLLNFALAGAVRPEEIFSALRELAQLTPKTALLNGVSKDDKPLIDAAKKVLAGLGVPQQVLDETQAKAAAVDAMVTNLAAAVSNTAASFNMAAKVSFDAHVANLQAQAESALTEITKKTVQFAKEVTDGYARFQFWFDSGQDRAQQWFTTNTRWFTTFLAVLFAFAFQIDTVEVYRDLSRNPAKTKAIAAKASGVVEQGERILSDDGKIFEAALKKWIDAQPDQATRDKLKPVAEVKFAPGDTRSEAIKKVDTAKANAFPSNPPKLTGTFENALDDVVAERLKLEKGQYISLRTALDKTGFEIIPSGENWRWGKNWNDGFETHFLGMLFSAALLTLGAPFWFNTLKGLTNLRSALANELDPQTTTKKPAETPTNSPATKPPPAPTAP